MRRKIICTLMLFLFILIPLQGCSSIKDEAELMNDLQSSNAFSIPDDVTVNSLTVIKRLTDEKNKTDKVYVQVDIDNAEFSQSRAYIMDYTHYNEGWILDNVEEYWENEYWTVYPKTAPSEETILSELIDWSNTSIRANYDWATKESPMQGPLFFEDGKYDVSFADGNFE